MIRRALLCSPALALALAHGGWGAEDGQVPYHNSFETETGIKAHIPSWMNAARPRLVRKVVDSQDAAEGKSSLLVECHFARAGWCYPVFDFLSPVALEGKPLYFSCYFKVVKQDPEADRRFPPGILLGFRQGLVHQVALPSGWTYFYTDDLRDIEVATGKSRSREAVQGFNIMIHGIRAGEEIIFRIDSVRLTRYNPAPPVDDRTYEKALAFRERLVREQASWRRLTHPEIAPEKPGRAAARTIDEALRALNALDREKDRIPAKEFRARLVGKIRECEKFYWPLQIALLAELD